MLFAEAHDKYEAHKQIVYSGIKEAITLNVGGIA